MKMTLGGHRLGSGKKMQVDLHAYDRSTHDLGYLWRSSMAPGTLIPFIKEIALPGDTFDITLNADVKTHPTLGPLFGSFKLQLDIFEAPLRLYHSALHNNALAIGNNMQNVFLPQIQVTNIPQTNAGNVPDLDNAQVNPSNILKYLGIRGWGYTGTANQARSFCAIPFLAYWEIYKQYYSNKQEGIGYVITPPAPTASITSITIGGVALSTAPPGVAISTNGACVIAWPGAAPDLTQIMVNTLEFGIKPVTAIWQFPALGASPVTSTYTILPNKNATYWGYANGGITTNLTSFPLANIDTMRTALLGNSPTAQYLIQNTANVPYSTPIIITNATGSQCGLGIKTYQSDLFNNWISTAWLDGVGGVNQVTEVSTAGGFFQIDALVMARKVYDFLNRVAISGGTYDDWLRAAYDHTSVTRAEMPMYHGGLSKEIIFNQVVSLAGSGQQPLGTLAGHGGMSHKHKGGKTRIKVDEPGYIIGIVSITPRIDYSQGNKWDVTLATMNDFHKPAFDEIGFQQLITEGMAWWDTHWNGSIWSTNSAGKQAAWLNYMTNVNQCYGNFAIANNEMFMTLNRRYTPNTSFQINDLTTYIDPSKYNFIFAQTNLDAQNFWVQIAIDMTVRRKMSAKLMPNL